MNTKDVRSLQWALPHRANKIYRDPLMHRRIKKWQEHGQHEMMSWRAYGHFMGNSSSWTIMLLSCFLDYLLYLDPYGMLEFIFLNLKLMFWNVVAFSISRFESICCVHVVYLCKRTEGIAKEKVSWISFGKAQTHLHDAETWTCFFLPVTGYYIDLQMAPPRISLLAMQIIQRVRGFLRYHAPHDGNIHFTLQ
jgi:hypothetical protein